MEIKGRAKRERDIIIEKKRISMKSFIGVVAILLIIIIGTISYYQIILEKESPSDYIQPSKWISDEEIKTEVDFNKMRLSLTVDITDVNLGNSIDEIMIVPVGHTGSMEPVMFGDNKLIALSIADKDLIMPGDIIGFRAENRTIVHRVVEKCYEYYNTTYEPVFRTKGDNCTEVDPWIVKPGDIEGVVIGVLY